MGDERGSDREVLAVLSVVNRCPTKVLRSRLKRHALAKEAIGVHEQRRPPDTSLLQTRNKLSHRSWWKRKIGPKFENPVMAPTKLALLIGTHHIPATEHPLPLHVKLLSSNVWRNFRVQTGHALESGNKSAVFLACAHV